jgi:hypothetical protein
MMYEEGWNTKIKLTTQGKLLEDGEDDLRHETQKVIVADRTEQRIRWRTSPLSKKLDDSISQLILRADSS